MAIARLAKKMESTKINLILQQNLKKQVQLQKYRFTNTYIINHLQGKQKMFTFLIVWVYNSKTI